MKPAVHIRLFTENPGQGEMIAQILGSSVVVTEDAYESDLGIVVGDLALLDSFMKNCPPQPMIMIGMEDSARQAVLALKAGATDYLVYGKDLAERLLPAVERARQQVQSARLDPGDRTAQDQQTLAEALHDTTTALITTLDFDEVLDRILANVARVVPYDTGNVMLVEGNRARMVRNRRASAPEQEIEVPLVDFDISAMPTLHWMAEKRQPIHIADTSTYAAWVSLPQSAWIRSFVGAPILDDGHVTGFLTLNSETAGTFQAQDAQRLQAFANYASIAIRNARLFDTAQRYTAELERRVNERTAELKLERNQLQAILESTGEGIVYMADDRIQYVNPALTRMTGYSAYVLHGQSITTLDPDGNIGETWQAILNRIRRGVLTWRDEARVTRIDGSDFHAGLTTSLSGHPADEILHTVTVLRDISQEKALEDQKSQFIATASHELRTPITNMRTRLYLIEHQPERMGDHLQVMDSVVLRMQTLVEDLLDQSRFERGMIHLESEKLLLQDQIIAVVRTQQAEARARDIHLSTDLEARPQYVMGDAGRLEQVITNLLTNSLYYTAEGGAVRVQLVAQGDQVVIHVRDNGIGIAAEHLDEIFEPFVRGNDKVKGTGLGLSIARQIVEMHGGEIRVESEPGRGSCFSVILRRLDEDE